MIYPGSVTSGPEAVPDPATTTLTFTWEDTSSEDSYELKVYDAFGVETWTIPVPRVTGAGPATFDYAGPALVPGMYYQWRVAALDHSTPAAVLTRTEDLLGVFYLE